MTQISDTILALVHSPHSTLTLRQIGIMVSASRSPGVGVKELARSLRISKPSVTRGVSTLQTQGLVDNIADEADKRLRTIYLTPRGYDVLTEIGARDSDNIWKDVAA